MKKALILDPTSGRSVNNDEEFIESSDTATSSTADRVPRADGSGKIAVDWLPIGLGGDVLVRDVSSVIEVNPVASLVFPDGSLVDGGAGQVLVSTGGVIGSPSVKKQTAVFTGNGTQTYFPLPFVGSSAYGLEVNIRLSDGSRKKLMLDEYTEVVGYYADCSSEGTPSVSAAGGNASLVFDGNTATYVDFGGTVPGWACVDFGAGNTKAIRKMRAYLWGYTFGYPNAGKIQASHDNATWVDITTWTDPIEAAGWIDVLWSPAGSFRYWRFTVTNKSYGYSGYVITEVEMMEASNGISGIQLSTAPASGSRIEIEYYIPGGSLNPDGEIYASIHGVPTSTRLASWTDGSTIGDSGVAVSLLSGTKTANTLFAGPASGSAAAPAFRALVAADLPSDVARLSQANTFTAANTFTQDIKAAGDTLGLFNRCANVLENPTDHFTAWSGWTWANDADFPGAPTAISGDYPSVIVFNSAYTGTRYFAYKPDNDQYNAVKIRATPGLWPSQIGVRVDNGTSNTFIELFLIGDNAGKVRVLTRYRSGGGAITQTELVSGLPAGWIKLQLYKYPDGAWLYYGTDAPFMPLAYIGAGYQMTVARFGMVFVSGSNYWTQYNVYVDWFSTS